MSKHLLTFLFFLLPMVLCAGQIERELVLSLHKGDTEAAKKLLEAGANPSIAMIEAEFLGAEKFNDVRILLASSYGGNWPDAKKERDRIVDNLDDISDVIKDAPLKFYRTKHGKDYYMIAPDPGKRPHPRGERGIEFFKDTPYGDKYLTWIQGSASRGAWNSIADKVRQGFGIIGLNKDLLKTDMMDVIAYFPDTKISADYLFDLIHPEPDTIRNEYQIGLLLSYWEPNVYAFVFGTDAAKLAYPGLELNNESKTPYDEWTLKALRKAGKHGLEAIPSEERRRVLREFDPIDEQFGK